MTPLNMAIGCPKNSIITDLAISTILLSSGFSKITGYYLCEFVVVCENSLGCKSMSDEKKTEFEELTRLPLLYGRVKRREQLHQSCSPFILNHI
jgi:hypothetical protein